VTRKPAQGLATVVLGMLEQAELEPTVAVSRGELVERRTSVPWLKDAESPG